MAEAEDYRRTYGLIRRQFPDAKFVANTKATASSFCRWLGWEERAVDVIYNGYDFSEMTPAIGARANIRRDLGIPLEAYVFGGVFRMSEEKRPFLWLRIADEISRKYDGEVHFVIVGDGPLFETVLRRLAEHPQPNVHVVGRKSNIADWCDFDGRVSLNFESRRHGQRSDRGSVVWITGHLLQSWRPRRNFDIRSDRFLSRR